MRRGPRKAAPGAPQSTRGGLRTAPGGGAGGGAWPRCGAARNPSWRPRGSASVPEQRRGRSRLLGAAVEEPLRGPRPLSAGGRRGPSAEFGGCDCLAAASGAAGRGRLGQRPPGWGQLRRPGLLSARPACRLSSCLSSLAAPPRLWDPPPGGWSARSGRGTPRFLRRGEASPPSKPPVPAPEPPRAPGPGDPSQTRCAPSGGLPWPAGVPPPASEARTPPNVTSGRLGLSPARNLNAKEEPGLVPQAF